MYSRNLSCDSISEGTEINEIAVYEFRVICLIKQGEAELHLGAHLQIWYFDIPLNHIWQRKNEALFKAYSSLLSIVLPPVAARTTAAAQHRARSCLACSTCGRL